VVERGAGGTGGSGAARGTAAGPAEVPLARLFAMAFRDMVDGLHARLAERGWRDVRPAFGFVLLAVRERPATTTELASRLGTTKQAASKLVGAMVDAGYLANRAHPEDSRAKLATLTPRGHLLLAAVEEVYRELEAQWAELIGRAGVEVLRDHLGTVLRATHGGRLPPVRPT
jgi:DNA-binding MarR family transcriptional regulator